VPGAVIGEVWQVEEILGKGGTGSVYRCHNLHAQRIQAAIKLLDPSFQGEPEARKGFLREAEILYTVDHPNVVKVSNVYLDAQLPYIEMEFVDGQPLNEVIAERGAIPPDTALDWARQMASALAYLHRKRIHHRDIKPHNILLRADGTLKVVDFGLASEQTKKRGDTVLPEGGSFGTVAYCPPEWARAETLHPVTWDLYAVGVILYELLTGEIAFPGPENSDATMEERALAIMLEKQQIQSLDPGQRFHPELREIVRRLTSKALGDRIPDARTLLDRLEAIDDPTWALPDVPADDEPVGHPTTTLLVVGGLIVVAAGGALFGVVAALALVLYAMS
jgi:serine/threonine-protein kinase